MPNVRYWERLGVQTVGKVYWNLSAPALYEEAIRRREGSVAKDGALVVHTGRHTGRSANDKFIVREKLSEDKIWWAKNKPMSPEAFDNLYRKMMAYLADKDLFIQDCHAGADTDYRLSVRVVTETAWHSLFARNMFIPAAHSNGEDFAPGFTVVSAPGFAADPAIDGTSSETFIVLSFERKMVLIGGTSYAGEIKKSVFTVLNYLLPQQGVLSMHCSANVGKEGDTAIFFGLSGTGKTTLSADPERALIGDDEHGWSDGGVFNFEGGCYAKVIRLSETAEPEIYATTRRFGTILENVVMNIANRELDLDDDTLTENTRASYPIAFIPNTVESGQAGIPRHVVMLTADAFGVLPPIAKLTPEQAMYHFLSGYTAKLAGTEKGLGKEPQATFSACFGAPFMALHPTVYAELLGKKIAENEVTCWLVNTGWSGGAFGEGQRMPIAYTRALLHAALDGKLAKVETKQDEVFGLHVPVSCDGVPTEILSPRNTWKDGKAYDAQAQKLAKMFQDNIAQFAGQVPESILSAGPKAAELV